MAYQVGFSCVDTLQDAGNAACGAYPPTTYQGSDGVVRTYYCNGATSTGGLQIYRKQVLNDGSNTTGLSHSFYPFYEPCQYQQYVDASLSIFVAVLTAWAGWYCVKWLYEYFNGWINWTRGDDK